MRALAIRPRQPNSARLLDVEAPKLEPGRVLVRVLCVGLCGTDYELLGGVFGQAPPGDDFLILGHESLGQVEAVGDGVSGFAPGHYVVATVRRPDGCLNCRSGESDMCLQGDYTERGIKGAHGYMADLYSESPEFLVPVPPTLREVGVLLEPLSVVEKAVRQAFRIQERMRWQPRRGVVLGAGAIGLLATALLRLRGLQTHTLARSAPGSPACRIVEEMGGTYWSSLEHPLASLAQELGQIDIIVEATGNGQVAAAAAQSLGTNGVMCLLGVYTGDHRQEVPVDRMYLEMVLGNKLMVGVVNANRSYFEAGIEDMGHIGSRWPGLLPHLLSRRLPLERFGEALKRPGGDIKTVLEIAPDA